MYCTPKLFLNKWLQSIQKRIGIHSKPLAALVVVVTIIVFLLIAIVIPAVSNGFNCVCF